MNEIVIPHQSEYEPPNEVLPYDFEDIVSLNRLDCILQNKTEELHIGISKTVLDKEYVVGMVDLVSLEDKSPVQINANNLSLLSDFYTKNGIFNIKEWKELVKITGMETGVNPKDICDDTLVAYYWNRKKEVSQVLIKRLLELGVDKNKILYDAKHPYSVYERSVEISENFKRPLEELLPVLRSEGYNHLPIHTHPVIRLEITPELESYANAVYSIDTFEDLISYADPITKMAYELRKQPTEEDLFMFEQLSNKKIGLLFTPEYTGDWSLNSKTMFAYMKENGSLKSIPVRRSEREEKNLIVDLVKEFSDFTKKYYPE